MRRKPRGPSRDRGFIALGAGHRVRIETGAQIGTIDDLRDATPERTFQAEHVVKVLKDHGWVVMVIPDMRRVEAGWPDVTAWHPNVPGLLLAWELKSAKGRPTWTQKRTLALLRTVPGVDARIVRPRDWEALRDVVIDTSRDPRAALAKIQEATP